MSEVARKLRLDLAYDGTDFAGWQFQPGQRTVQGVLEQVLGRIQGGERVVVTGAGRTDSGVHALGQVADCVLRTRMDDARLHRALRGMLPRDLRAVRVQEEEPRFSARFHATTKSYEYRVDTSSHGDPLLARFALHYPHDLDLDLVDSALRLLPGRRDWSGFTAAACEKQNRVRALSAARLERVAPDRLRFVFTADGFLQHMVRNIVGTLLEIGGRRMRPDTVEGILDSGNRDLAGPTAAARGLCLIRVEYK